MTQTLAPAPHWGTVPCAANPALWFSEHPADQLTAIRGCHTCPIATACLAGALRRREPHGVWGGALFAAGTPVRTAAHRPAA